MSVWEFLACIDGWNAAHGNDAPAEAEPMSLDRMAELGLMH